MNDYDANQDLLLDFMDEENDLCVPMAVLEEPTLNGHATSMDVRFFSGTTFFQDVPDSPAFIGCQWGFLVIPARA